MTRQGDRNVEMVIGRFLRYCMRTARSVEAEKVSPAYVRKQVKVILQLTLLLTAGLGVLMSVILACLFLLQATGVTPRAVYPWTYRILAGVVLILPVVSVFTATVGLLFDILEKRNR